MKRWFEYFRSHCARWFSQKFYTLTRIWIIYLQEIYKNKLRIIISEVIHSSSATPVRDGFIGFFPVEFVYKLPRKMPKKKTGQRKKAEKQRLRQKEIRSGRDAKPLAEWACNSNMVTISLGFWKINAGIFSYIARNATDASASRNSGPSVTSVSHYRGFQCVGTAVKSNACLKREIVLSSMAVFSLLAWGWW